MTPVGEFEVEAPNGERFTIRKYRGASTRVGELDSSGDMIRPRLTFQTSDGKEVIQNGDSTYTIVELNLVVQKITP
jgi:hypothetical protein